MGTKQRPSRVKQVLAGLGLAVKCAKNVANASNPISMKNRVERINMILETIKKKRITSNSTARYYALDECNINQLNLEDDVYVGLPGVDVFKKGHYSITTESLSLILLVDSQATIIHYEIFHNKSEGATDYHRIESFLNSAARKLNNKGKLTLFLDNAGPHAAVFKHTQVSKTWDPMWSPTCTPEANLAEYFFASYKAALIDALGNVNHTMKGPEWEIYNDNFLVKWVKNHGVPQTILTHIQDYLIDLSEVKGDLQELSLKYAGYKSFDDYFNRLD